MGQTKILVLNAQADSSLVRSLSAILQNAGPFEFQVTGIPWPSSSPAGDFPEAAVLFDGVPPDLALLCLSGDALEEAGRILETLRAYFNETPVVVVTDSDRSQSLSELLKLGVADFLVAPLRPHDVLPRLSRLHQFAVGQDSPIRQIKERLGLKQIIGESEILIQEIQKIPKIARCDASVLISGETGTGKEMFARAIHYLSPRSRQPFTPVNCGAIPLELVENELFGHEAGAYTSALSAMPGLIHDSDGGTLFLDEIDSLPLQSQVKLLRFLQDKEYRPLGSRRVCKADVRVIAASNANFADAIRSNRFRSDLYYRLNVIALSLPPLRQRQEDILLIARHLLAKCCRQYSLPLKHFSDGARKKLLTYEWPGNVRELENVIAGAIILSEKPIIHGEDIRLPAEASPPGESSFKALKARAVAEFETTYIRQLLVAHDGNITKAARAAHKNRRAFWQLMQKHNIRYSFPSSSH